MTLSTAAPSTSVAPAQHAASSCVATDCSCGVTGTVAHGMHTNPTILQSIDRIVAEMNQHKARITGVRPALDQAHEARMVEMLKQACAVRGRERLYFDYLGSGIGNGPFVEMADGSVKLDLICGIGVHFFGHSDSEAAATGLMAALADTVMAGNLQANHNVTEFAQVLLDKAAKTSKLAHAYLINGGCMANENAVKICFQKNAPANRVIAFEHCFMGRSVTMCQIGDNAANRVGIPLSTLVDYMPFYDPEMGTKSIDYGVKRLEEYVARYPKQHACFIFELIQGEGGFNSAPREYFTALMEVCRANGIAVWDDEVQTFGRTGEFFAFDKFNLGEFVDVCTIGKMSQVCAALYTREYNPKPGLLSATFIASAQEIEVGTLFLKRLLNGNYYGPNGTIEKHHVRFVEGIKALAARHPAWFPPVTYHGRTLTNTPIAGGVGGMMRFTPFGGDKQKVTDLLQVMFKEGLIAFYAGHGPFHVRFLPPLGVMDLATWDVAFELIERSMAKAAQ